MELGGQSWWGGKVEGTRHKGQSLRSYHCWKRRESGMWGQRARGGHVSWSMAKLWVAFEGDLSMLPAKWASFWKWLGCMGAGLQADLALVFSTLPHFTSFGVLGDLGVAKRSQGSPWPCPHARLCHSLYNYSLIAMASSTQVSELML